jgi:hydroxymethylglutaryl-CoA lyase
MVWLQEVGPRDGLQNESRVLSVDRRTHLIEALTDAGLPRIQIGSFVNPRRVPQMANTDLVWRKLHKKPSVRYSVLVLNAQGLERALSEKIPHVEIYVSASESHSRENSGATVEQALIDALSMIESALTHGVGVTAGIMCAFGCFVEEIVTREKVEEIVSAFQTLDPTEIALADTAGMARPEAVKDLLSTVKDLVDFNRLTLHLHDTRGFGMGNLVAALEMGVRRFDASVGGLGGCPFIPGAVGNISTEASASLLHALGYRTGVNVHRVREIKLTLDRELDAAVKADPGKQGRSGVEASARSPD